MWRRLIIARSLVRSRLRGLDKRLGCPDLVLKRCRRFALQISVVLDRRACGLTDVYVNEGFAQNSHPRYFRDRVPGNGDFVGCGQFHFHFSWTILALGIGSDATDGPHVNPGDPDRSSCPKTLNIVEAGFELSMKVSPSVDRQSCECSESDYHDQCEYDSPEQA